MPVKDDERNTMDENMNALPAEDRVKDALGLLALAVERLEARISESGENGGHVYHGTSVDDGGSDW